jgi:hypothetical protein
LQKKTAMYEVFEAGGYSLDERPPRSLLAELACEHSETDTRVYQLFQNWCKPNRRKEKHQPRGQLRRSSGVEKSQDTVREKVRNKLITTAERGLGNARIRGPESTRGGGGGGGKFRQPFKRGKSLSELNRLCKVS